MFLSLLGVAFSVLLYFYTQVSMLTRYGASMGSFRLFYSPDQLANVAVVVNGAHGNSASVEPFTETGTMVDPHLYLTVLGRISHFMHASPIVVYNVAGIALQIMLVVGLSIGFVVITRKWWAAFLGAVPFLLGTLSFVTSRNWYTMLTSHASLWGAFGDLFALNGQSAGLAIGALALVLALVVATRRFSPITSTVCAIIVAAAIGLLANVDTYSFFAALFFATYGLGVYGLTLARTRWPAAGSLAALLALLILGDTLASALGRVAVIALALIPAVPGVLLALRQWRVRLLLPLAALAAAAAPQLIRFEAAHRSGDPFTIFREVSSTGLTVTIGGGLICAAPLLIPLIAILLAGVHQRNRLWVAYSSGSMIAWFLIAANNLWGANQEPYQLWIDGFTLTAFTILPIAVDVARAYLPMKRPPGELTGSWSSSAVTWLLAASIVVGLLSTLDWAKFYKSQEAQFFSIGTGVAPERALVSVASGVTNRDLVMTDHCINPEVFKVLTGARVDFYSAGFAWPKRYQQIDVVKATMAAGTTTATELRAARIGWLVTDGSCANHWSSSFSKLLSPVKRSRYGAARSDVVTLWKINTNIALKGKR